MPPIMEYPRMRTDSEFWSLVATFESLANRSSESPGIEIRLIKPRPFQIQSYSVTTLHSALDVRT